jgi:XRE family transcriptional regulator, aerobic/anaerobic benzoate catabolism transcriptional regulator
MSASAPRERQNMESDSSAVLAAMGRRVRELRAGLGMTRKELAAASAVSERYVAEVELGRGNVSVLILRQLAEALRVSPALLLSVPDIAAGDRRALLRLVEQAPAAALPRLRRMLEKTFIADEAARDRRIALIGLRGAGKSTLGRLLARRAGVPFIELDAEIERAAGTPLSEIFLLYGQPGYRRYERECLERVLSAHPAFVLAAGGSVVTEPSTYELLLQRCRTVWLQARPEEHMARVVEQGDLRPMAGQVQAMNDLKRILASRKALYARADATLNTAGRSVAQSLKALRALCQPVAADAQPATHAEEIPA